MPISLAICALGPLDEFSEKKTIFEKFADGAFYLPPDDILYLFNALIKESNVCDYCNFRLFLKFRGVFLLDLNLMGVIYILDHLDWLKIMGYNMQHLSPQLMNTNDLPKFPNNLLPNLYPDIPPLSITPVGKHLTKKQQISVAQPVSG